MGIFDKIKNAIWGKDEAPASQPRASVDPSSPPVEASATAGAPRNPSAPASPAPAGTPGTAQPSGSQSAGAATTAGAAPSAQPVDVAAILDAAVKKNGQKLDWRKSIVDLMKALDLDSSLSARKELAGELGYTGDTNDSASMNIWLHKALMKKLSENGGKVPSELTA